MIENLYKMMVIIGLTLIAHIQFATYKTFQKQDYTLPSGVVCKDMIKDDGTFRLVNCSNDAEYIMVQEFKLIDRK